MIENVAVRLTLRPFDFHLNSEDDEEDVTDLTQLEYWSREECSYILSMMQEAFEDVLPNIRNVYVVVPEKGKPEMHDEYNGFFYPKVEVTGLLPWREAKEGTWIYTTHQLEVIEKEVAFEDWVNGSEPGYVPPELTMFVVDYAGREKRA